MAENFQNLTRDKRIDSRSRATPNRVSPKKFTSRHDIIKLLKTKTKKKILKSAREKQHVFVGENNLNDSGFLIRNHEG